MNLNEQVRVHLASIRAGHGHFSDTLNLISQHFSYEPTGFRNGPVTNSPGENEGSCRVFSLAQLCNLSESDTLNLFAEHYRSVLDDPTGDSHGNIRQFMTTGWSGIEFDGIALRPLPINDPNDTTEESN